MISEIAGVIADFLIILGFFSFTTVFLIFGYIFICNTYNAEDRNED